MSTATQRRAPSITTEEFAALSKRKPDQAEKRTQDGVTALLEIDGWRPLRTDPISERGFAKRIAARLSKHPTLARLAGPIMEVVSSCIRATGFGDPGMPDYLYIRYVRRNQDHPPSATPSGVAELLWIEYKAPSKTPKPHQVAWHLAERRRGALVLVIDDFDKFREWYRDSGLNRSLIVALPVKGKTA